MSKLRRQSEQRRHDVCVTLSNLRFFYQVLTEILTRPTGLVPDAKVEARNGVSILRPKPYRPTPMQKKLASRPRPLTDIPRIQLVFRAIHLLQSWKRRSASRCRCGRTRCSVSKTLGPVFFSVARFRRR